MQATKRPRVQREPETQANNHAYAPGLCFAAWAGWPCTSDCMSSAGAANKGGTDSCCVDGHCCRLGADCSETRLWSEAKSYPLGKPGGPIMLGVMGSETQHQANSRLRKAPANARFCRHFYGRCKDQQDARAQKERDECGHAPPGHSAAPAPAPAQAPEPMRCPECPKFRRGAQVSVITNNF